jgi:hypothetical protein
MRGALTMLLLLVVTGYAANRALAAIPEIARPRAGASRVVADAKASQALASRPLSPPLPLQEVIDIWQRQLREHANSVEARMEELNRRTYEIVGRLQLLVGFLVVLLLGVFVWLLELSRRLGTLETERGSPRGANAPSRRVG